MNNQRVFEETIITKQTKQDKLGRDYLLLELDNTERIFVFSSKVSKEKWSNLEESKKYEFTVEDGNNGSNLLVDFYSLEETSFF